MLRILQPACWRHAVVSHKRCVTTWSPLGVAFNTNPQRRLNFNLNRENVGLFGIPHLHDYTGFYLLQEEAHHEAEALVREATNSGRTRKLVQVFDDLSDCLCRVADMADFVRVAHPDPAYAQAAEEACMKISALVERLNTNVGIHKALQTVLQEGDHVPTSELDQRVAQLFMFDFEQSGIHLEENKRQEFVTLNEQIMMLGNYFMHGTQQPVSIKKDKLPKHIADILNVNGDSITITGLLSDHHSDIIREAAYKIFLYPHQHQQDLLEQLLSKRNDLACLVGFPTYAHRALRGTMAETPEIVMKFLETLADKVRPRADAELEQIKSMKWKNGYKTNVMPWDPPFYSGLARHEKYHIDNMELAPYFSLGSCMEGLGILFKSLFGIELQHVTPGFGELWSHDIYKLAVVHETEGTLGHIYCDFFERSGKPNQDCHFTIRGGRETSDGMYQDPAVVLLLNLPPPRGNVPSLLSPGQVENLFHEFGHAMHSMLGRTVYQHVTGTRCPTDFAEVPSVLMEYFINDPRVLSKFARHWQTGEPLPEDKIEKLCQSRKMFSAWEMQLTVLHSMLDQLYHGKHPLEGDVTQILAQAQNKYSSLPYVPGTAWQLRFGHFVGYGAKYYSYLWSRAVAARIWHSCFKQDPFSRSMGEHYHRNMLAHGGARPPAELVQDMLNEEPTPDRLVDSLMDDLDCK